MNSLLNRMSVRTLENSAFIMLTSTRLAIINFMQNETIKHTINKSNTINSNKGCSGKGGLKILKYSLVALLMLMLLVCFIACKNDSILPLEEQNHSLIGTKWYLVAFVDTENNTSRRPEYGLSIEQIKKCEDSLRYWHHYTIAFYNDSLIDGNGFFNGIFSYYYINSSNVNGNCRLSLYAYRYREAAIVYDEQLFLDVLNEIQSYFYLKTTSPNQLKLFYDNEKKYLLFEPSEYIFPWNNYKPWE